MLKRIPIVLLLLVSLQSFSQTPNWSQNVAPILYNNCVTCHRSGGIAPFALMSYNDAITNAATMSADVSIGKMPPWPPDVKYTHLAHERLLTAAQIKTINDWVSGGTPKGDSTLAPPKPTFATNGDLPGTPDLVIKIPAYTSTSATSDVYQCFAIPSGLLADKYITSFEAVPGNRAIVHHVLVYTDTTGVCAHLDSLSPGPGYPNFGGVGSNSATLIGAWVPGTAPMKYPSGFGVRVPKNSYIVLQIHYPAGTAGQKDSTELHFFFAPSPAGIRNVYIDPVLNYYNNIDRPLSIPANTVQSFYEHYALPLNFSLLGVAPHMHLLGQNIRSYYVNGADTTPLIRINKWDFHWQGFYMFPKIRKVPAGSTVYANATYDNTTANPENPNSPPQLVVAGEQTTNEMMLVYFVFTLYQPGDENIVIDSAVASEVTPLTYYHGQQLLDPYPNPAKDVLIAKCYFEQADMGSMELTNIEGKVVKPLAKNMRIEQGYSSYRYSVADLPTGTYILRLTTSERILTKKVVIEK